MARVAFAPDVFTDTDPPELIGSRCGQCAAVAFPFQSTCARCGADTERHLLPRRGTLWTFTTQDFLPKEPYAGGETPDTFQPFGVGLIELVGPDGPVVRVEGRLTIGDPEQLRIGDEFELVLVPFRTDPDGTEVVTFAFAPVGGQS